MNFPGHITGGIITGVVSSAVVFNQTHHIETALGAGAFAIVCALYPDTDIKSKPSQMFIPFMILMAIVGFFTFHWVLSVVFLILVGVSAVAPHRGITHSIAFGALFSFAIPTLLLGLFIPSIVFAGMAGYATHLLLDRHFKLL